MSIAQDNYIGGAVAAVTFKEEGGAI